MSLAASLDQNKGDSNPPVNPGEYMIVANLILSNAIPFLTKGTLEPTP